MPAKEKKSEHVTVGGRPWDSKDLDTHTGNLMWGALLIILGVLFFFNTLGIISWDAWGALWKLWPVLIILWGIQIIFGRGKMGRSIMGVITAFFLLFILLFILRHAIPQLSHNFPPALNQIYNQMEGALQ